MEIKEITRRSEDVLADVREIEIIDNRQFGYTTNLLKDIKLLQKAISEHYDPMIKKAHETHKEILSAKKSQHEPLKMAERELKIKIADFTTKQEQIRREEERRLREEARKLEEARLLEQAVETNNEGLLDEPVIVPVVKIEDDTKTEGISYSEIWRFEIIDESKIPDDYKIIDQKKIGQVVRAMKDKTSIPGVKVYCTKSVRVRT